MKQETTNDSIIIVVEPGDERTSILATLAGLANQRIIVALPDDAVFHRPGDLRELGQAAAQANVELTLVIASNERLRLWARAQGFTVFSSLEICARSQSSSAVLPSVLSKSSESFVSSAFPKSSGQFKVPGIPIARQTPRVTEPLYARPVAPRVPDLASELAQSGVPSESMHMYTGHTQAVDARFADVQLTNTPVDIQLIDVQKALHKQIAEEKAQDRLSQPFSLLSNAPVLPVGTEIETQPGPVDLSTLPNRESTRTLWHDRLLFILVALLVLGIMGGLSFGYLLSLAHIASAPLLPASLSVAYQVVQ